MPSTRLEGAGEGSCLLRNPIYYYRNAPCCRIHESTLPLSAILSLLRDIIPSYSSLSQVTRGLRARLSYASYKATHNIPRASLRDLEAQTQHQSQTASFSRTIAAKRKATGVNNYYNNPATQGPNGGHTGANSQRRGNPGAMPPPAAFASPRSYHSTVTGGVNATTSNSDSLSASRNPANSGVSLYTSILSLTPAKHARTIHNANDPPVAAPTRPTASPRVRGAKASPRSIAEGTRAQVKGRQSGKASGHSGSQDKRKAKRSSMEKGKHKQKVAGGMDVDADGDVDMKAAATLTSLLLHHRPSIGSASSPRSSVDGSENSSVYSYSHFAQSAARTTTSVTPRPISAAPSMSTPNEPAFRNQTPPPPSAQSTQQHTTPRPAPADSEAANLMLFLATSPSPARPSGKDSKDLAAYRALTGGPLRSKGRVLFPEPSGLDEPHLGAGSQKTGSALTRGGDNSFTSSISSIGSDIGGRNEPPQARVPTHTLPSQLLPPPPMPFAGSTPGTPVASRDLHQSPKPLYNQGSVEFNFSDFIHASPSPSRGTVGQGHKSNLGLRADVGRKLFEEEQLRHALNTQTAGKRQEERGLAAGIDLIQS